MKDYLAKEWTDKHGTGDGVVVRGQIKAIYPHDLPHQANYTDCGIYLLQFARNIIVKNPKVCFTVMATRFFNSVYRKSSISLGKNSKIP